jgi:hypothetical protein
VNVETLSSGEGFIFDNFDLVVLQPRAKRRHIEDANGGMCLGSRGEISVHPDVQLVHTTLQPDAAAGLEGCGLGEFRHAKYFDVKLAGRGFAPRWRGELNVVDAEIEVHRPAVALR